MKLSYRSPSVDIDYILTVPAFDSKENRGKEVAYLRWLHCKSAKEHKSGAAQVEEREALHSCHRSIGCPGPHTIKQVAEA